MFRSVCSCACLICCAEGRVQIGIIEKASKVLFAFDHSVVLKWIPLPTMAHIAHRPNRTIWFLRFQACAITLVTQNCQSHCSRAMPDKMKEFTKSVFTHFHCAMTFPCCRVLHIFTEIDRKAVISSPLLLLQKTNIIGLYSLLSALSDQNSRTQYEQLVSVLSLQAFWR